MRGCNQQLLDKEMTMSKTRTAQPRRLVRVGDAHQLTRESIVGLYAESFQPGRYTPA